LAGRPEWVKPKSGVEVATIVAAAETTEAAPAVEMMTAVEGTRRTDTAITAMAHDERMAAEAVSSTEAAAMARDEWEAAATTATTMTAATHAATVATATTGHRPRRRADRQHRAQRDRRQDCC
jgi:hypothetical protein